MSARRRGIKSVDEQITHAITLGIFGGTISTGIRLFAIHYFEFQPDETFSYTLILLSGVVGLFGIALFDEVFARAIEFTRTVRLGSIFDWLANSWAESRKRKQENGDKTDDGR